MTIVNFIYDKTKENFDLREQGVIGKYSCHRLRLSTQDITFNGSQSKRIISKVDHCLLKRIR